MALAATVAVLGASLVFGAATPALGKKHERRINKLERRINATRRSQLAEESRMLAADHAIRSLKVQRTKVERKVRASNQHLIANRARQQIIAARLSTIRVELSAASGAQDAAPATLLGVTTPLTELLLSDTAVTSTDPARLDLGLVNPPVPPSDDGTIKQLKAGLKANKQRLRRVQRRARKIVRTRRSATHRLAAIKRERSAAFAQRAKAEAALEKHIETMTRLAFSRANRHSDVRPGRNKPFVWPARGRISQRFGCTGFRLEPASGSCAHFHDGVDLVAARGAPIRAMGVGVIAYIGRNPWDQGKRAFVITIAHPGGFKTLYGHLLPKRRVRVGQLVHKGQVIGFMGSTGHSTGVHLHVEVRRGQRAYDPLAFLN